MFHTDEYPHFPRHPTHIADRQRHAGNGSLVVN
jgi:hypothetical protein